jgi:hypothetical protein
MSRESQVVVPQNCGCPPGYVDIGSGICQLIEAIPATPPSQPIGVVDIDSAQNVHILYGAIIFENITLKQWPIMASPQGNINPPNTNFYTNTKLSVSGPNPNPYLPGGLPYTSLNPGTDGINYTGGLGPNGEHAKIIKPIPAGWPFITSAPNTYPYQSRALRESTITSGVLNYGIGAHILPLQQIMGAPWRDNTTNWLDQVGIQPDICVQCDPSGTSATCYHCSRWYGFVHCVQINQQKTYYVAVAANNAYRFFMNDDLVVEFNVGDGLEPSLANVSIFPITLPAGTHVFRVDMLNYLSNGGLGFDIYDCSLAQLQGASSMAELLSYTVFSAKDRVGGIFDSSTAPNQGYTCPEGYIYSNCDGPQCIQIVSEDVQPFNVKLTPCCGDQLLSFVIEKTESFPTEIVPGQTICTTDLDDSIQCWFIENTCDPINFTNPVTVTGIYANCSKCYVECTQCIDEYYTLNDCCTNEPYKDNQGDVMIFNYIGVSDNGNTPESLAGLIVTEVRNNLDVIIAEGCLILTIISINDFPVNNTIINWNKPFSEVNTVPTCEDCKACRTCYQLTNCDEPLEILITETDLSLFVNNVISIEGCKDKCWTVTLAADCNDCQGPVTIIDSFDDCIECLPQPEPIVPAPLLNPRAVKPGYKTPGCSPEYTEKVNCAFGEMMNKQMLTTRYGIETCCENSDTDWEIKKELLDFEAIKDINLTPYTNESL